MELSVLVSVVVSLFSSIFAISTGVTLWVSTPARFFSLREAGLIGLGVINLGLFAINIMHIIRIMALDVMAS